jgi:hypothetical protein
VAIAPTTQKKKNSFALTRVRSGAPFDGKITALEDNKTIIHKVKTPVSWQAA